MRGDIGDNAKPFFELDYTIGPLWLDFAKIPLGELQLGALEGTRASHEVDDGTKTWYQWQQAGNVELSNGSPQQRL